MRKRAWNQRKRHFAADILDKIAANGVNDYLRMRAREDGFARRIRPPVPVRAEDLDQQVDKVRPRMVPEPFVIPAEIADPVTVRWHKARV